MSRSVSEQLLLMANLRRMQHVAGLHSIFGPMQDVLIRGASY